MAAGARWETAQRWYEVKPVCDLLATGSLCVTARNGKRLCSHLTPFSAQNNCNWQSLPAHI